MSESDLSGWVFWFPFVWIGSVIAASVLYRRIHGKPIVPRAPERAVFKERAASGWNDSHLLGRLGAANRCLLVTVTAREVAVTPFFPLNLMFLPEIYGLELQTPISRVRRIEERRRFFRDYLIIELDDGGRFGLHLRDPAAFKRALGRA